MSGLGADEIFGGYSRYWVSFRRGGFEELKDEMSFGKYNNKYFFNENFKSNFILLSFYLLKSIKRYFIF